MCGPDPRGHATLAGKARILLRADCHRVMIAGTGGRAGAVAPDSTTISEGAVMFRSVRASILSISLAIALACPVFDADAKTLRWAGRGDMQTTDPHSQNEGLTNNINQLVYEFLLVSATRQLNLVPSLAESWTAVNPTTWRFKLRPGVKFHDGTPFTADDVVFSFERARSDTSQLRAYANAVGHPEEDRRPDRRIHHRPGPIRSMLEHVATINIMSKAWCEKNRATKPQNYTHKEDMITARAGERHRRLHR